MHRVEVRLSPAIAALLHYPAETFTLSLSVDRSSSLRDLLLHLEQQAPGVLLEPITGRLRSHLHLFLNRGRVSDMGHSLDKGDVVEIHLRMIEGG